jgi:hypothetical protein
MFGLRVSKSERPDKTPFTIYTTHSSTQPSPSWREDYYQVLSIDPARKNYALRIERRYLRSQQGQVVSGRIIPLAFEKVSIVMETDKETLNSEAFFRLTTFLDKYEHLYAGTHIFVIERQLPQNYKATRIAQHTLTYFMLKLKDSPLRPLIVEVDPQLKGRQLGAPKGIGDKQLKDWAVQQALELLQYRSDSESLKLLQQIKKKDDLADTICQIEALFKYWQLPITLPMQDFFQGLELEDLSRMAPIPNVQQFLSHAPIRPAAQHEFVLAPTCPNVMGNFNYSPTNGYNLTPASTMVIHANYPTHTPLNGNGIHGANPLCLQLIQERSPALLSQAVSTEKITFEIVP